MELFLTLAAIATLVVLAAERRKGRRERENLEKAVRELEKVEGPQLPETDFESLDKASDNVVPTGKRQSRPEAFRSH